MTVRLRDMAAPVRCERRSACSAGVAAAASSPLCEDAEGEALPVAGGAAQVTVPQAGLVTLSVRPAPVSLPGTGCRAGPGARGRPDGEDGRRRGRYRRRRQCLAAQAASAAQAVRLPEPAQPVYARYWLHGKGPAPAGNMPVAVHLSPAALTLDDGQPGTLRLTVACGPEPAAGLVRLSAPDEIVLSPSGPLSYDLARSAIARSTWPWPRSRARRRVAGLRRPRSPMPPGRSSRTARCSLSASRLIRAWICR